MNYSILKYSVVNFLSIIMLLDCRSDVREMPSLRIRLALPQLQVKRQFVNEPTVDLTDITGVRFSISTKRDPQKDGDYVKKESLVMIENTISKGISLIPSIYYITELKALNKGDKTIFFAVNENSDEQLRSFVNPASILPVKFSLVESDTTVSIELLPSSYLEDKLIGEFSTHKKRLKLGLEVESTSKFYLYCYYDDILTREVKLSLEGIRADKSHRYIYKDVDLSEKLGKGLGGASITFPTDGYEKYKLKIVHKEGGIFIKELEGDQLSAYTESSPLFVRISSAVTKVGR